MLTDPFGPKVGHSMGRPTADIVTISHPSENHANVDGVGGEFKLVNGPGEYDLHNIAITGVQTRRLDENGSPAGVNTVYLMEMDELVICHLGELGKKLTESEAESMPDVDILLVPVGGIGTLNAPQAVEVISQLEPRLVIPMHYRTEGVALELETVDRFVREIGAGSVQPQPRVNVTRSSLPESTQVVLLEPRKVG